jgi:hypothetical protein
MEVVSPVLPATTVAWQPRAGQWALTVVCKATFVLEPGEARIAQEHDPLAEGDQYWDDDATRSLFYASDLVPVKRRADVLLVGHAFAPGGTRVRQLVARMMVDKLDKSIGIFADRTRGTDGSVYEGRGFTRMPLVYERAAGGPTTWNPVGVRADMRDSYGNTALPNLVLPGTPPTDFGEPVGFGPISPSWGPRSELWVFEGWSGNWTQESLPDSFDLGFFNVAPRDQQTETLRDDCMIHLEHLHPEHAQLTTSLPGVRPRVSIEGADRRQRPVTMRADALFIDSDRGVATMVWRGHVSIEHPQESGRVLIELEEDRVDDPRTATNAWSTSNGTIPTSTAKETSRPEMPEGNRMPTRELSRQPAATAQAPVTFDDRNRVATPFGPPKTERPVQVPAGRPATSPPPAAALPFANKGQAPRGPRTMIATEMPPGLLAAATPFAPAAAPPVATSAPPLFSAPPAVAPPPLVPHLQPASQPAHALAPMPQPPVAVVPHHSALGAPMTGPPLAAPARPPIVQHASAAALGGLASASNAAADPTPRGSAAAQAPAFRGDVLHLLWFEPEAAPRVRRRPEWKKLLDEMENAPADPDVDQPGLADEPSEMEDRREIFEVLCRGKPSGEDGVQQALAGAVRSDGRFAPQLLLLTGELRFDFDEVETLKANAGAAMPLAGADEDLKTAIEQANKLLASPDLVVSAEIVEGMTKRIRDAFIKAPRVVGPTYLEDQTERVLIERRAYQRRDVFGAKHLRALFFHDGSTTGVPTYLAEGLAKKLPLFRRLRVKMLVETHFQADQYESHAAALKAAAVARLVRTG